MEEVKVTHITSNLSVDVVRKDIKNMHLAVYPPTGRVRIAAPLNVNDEAVRLFAISKIAWIRKHQRNFVAQDRQSPREYKQRESHYFQGKRFLLRVTEHEAPAKVELKTKTYIDLFVRPNSTLEQKQIVINDWYRAELKKLIPDLIDKWENKVGVKVSHWQVKQMKTKWGTCNIEEKRIWINLELAKKPLHCLEYIIVHEMLHLIERHHNDRFMALMDKYIPQWKFYKEELNRLPVNHGEWDY
ncbi:MAG: metal-dependent hydrolase [Bacteroidetes bacterium GWF2_42_66]|nr:MAG: metal-dependent hydrolase [Bacteroidetes bacterium GWA2_42_15]OFX98914.1 MAG: metal-dependent hydrolase [Bacteroidetes bacterium GWE2_42_39]OFY45629.1 MAG: metal-dependent hydrolase [Bacteroidetes bacterium GWF2_42_66]HBL77390.1 metal-dependent hydrolase [Prolixibacteraceae bacterium]HCU62446.1 metal-dependent hydrolase [Prolixibacteraceae bacterium]